MSGYSLIRPCAKCPFRTDIPPFLKKSRVREIQRSLVTSEFYCHETLDDSGWSNEDDASGSYYPRGSEEHCAGALILLEKIARPSQMMRITERLGMYDCRKLDMKAPVFASFTAMIRRQA